MTKRRTALVTGANRGIGRAIAAALQPDLRVIAACRRLEDAERTAAELGIEGAQLDLSDAATVVSVANALLEQLGPIDVLVNNAAILTEGEATTDKMIRSMSVNALAPYALIRVLGPAMKRRGYGRIVNVSSGCPTGTTPASGPLVDGRLTLIAAR